MTRCWQGDRRGDDRGSASVLVLSLLAVLALVGGLLVAAGVLVVTRHRAGSAADLAALAAAARVLDGPGVACAAADRVARAVGASVTGCALQEGGAVVTVEVLPPGGLAALGPARAVARAGPAAARAGTSVPARA